MTPAPLGIDPRSCATGRGPVVAPGLTLDPPDAWHPPANYSYDPAGDAFDPYDPADGSLVAREAGPPPPPYPPMPTGGYDTKLLCPPATGFMNTMPGGLVRVGDCYNTSAVTSMYNMFIGATGFNHPFMIDTSAVTIMGGVFYRATYFNQPIGNWDMSSVTKMGSMFCYASAFN